MKIRFTALVLAAMLSAAAPAQDYPARPVRLVVPYAAGGNADIFGRTLAQKLGDALIKSDLQMYTKLIKDAKVPAQ